MKNGVEIATNEFYSFYFPKIVLESSRRSHTYTCSRKSIDFIFCVLENGYTYYVSLTIGNIKIN